MNPATILVVNDDRLILLTLVQGLRDAGYNVFETESGEQAIETCAVISPDLAILDIHMSGLSGLEVGQWLNEHTNTPFIFLSDYNDQPTVQQATDNGALGFLVKPLDVDRILPTVQVALARAEDMRKLQQSEQHLNNALKGSRNISLAMGILMERNHINPQEAFELLRGSARNQRRKTVEIAEEIIAGNPLV